MAMQDVDTQAVLKFAAISANATEESPLKLGNVELWIGKGSWDGELCHFPTTSQWDIDTFQRALNEYLTPLWDELCRALRVA